MVRRVREMLRLQAEAGPETIRVTALSFYAAVEEVSGVELNARLRGGYIECSTGRRIDHVNHRPETPHLSVQYEIVIVALAALKLFVVRVNTFAYIVGLAEVERRSLHRLELAGWD